MAEELQLQLFDDASGQSTTSDSHDESDSYTIRNPYEGKRWERAKLAYALFKESAGKTLNIATISSRTGWSTATIKTYVTKRWRGFLSEVTQGVFYVHELSMSENNFCMFHSQVGSSQVDSPHLNISYIEKLGAGKYGTVWKAFDNDLGRTVAVKVFYDDVGSLDTLFHAKQIAGVDYHPNVVPIYHYGLVPDPSQKKRSIQALVMPYLRGTTLEKRCEERFTKEEAQTIGIGICQGLKQIHRSRLIHGDLHAKNIMICGSIPILIDLMNANARTAKTSSRDKISYERDLFALGHILQTILELTIAVPEHLLGSSLYSVSIDASLEMFLESLALDLEEEEIEEQDD